MRMFNWNDLGTLPYDAWGGGYEGDGTDGFGDGGQFVVFRGDCVDPTVHRQPLRAYHDGHTCADGTFCLPAFSRRSPRKNGKPAEVQCPSADPPTTLILRDSRWEQLTDRVWRKVKPLAAAIPQTAVA